MMNTPSLSPVAPLFCGGLTLSVKRAGRFAVFLAGLTAGSLGAGAVWAQDAGAQAASGDVETRGDFPTPAIVTPSWSLTVEAGLPNTVAVRVQNRTRWYWYMPFSVTNLGNEPVFFVPNLTVLTDGGRLIHTNRGLPPEVFRVVEQELRNPLLMPLHETQGRQMLPGRDSELETVAIWPVPDEDVDRFDVFIGGVYGESAPVPDPVTGEPMMRPALDPLTGAEMLDAAGDPVMEQVQVVRTLKLSFFAPGTPRTPERVPVTRTGTRDVMR